MKQCSAMFRLMAVPTGKHHAQPVGRIEKRRLQGAEVWRSGKEMRIPEHEVAVTESVEPEAIPMEKEAGDVVAAARKNVIPPEVKSRHTYIANVYARKIAQAVASACPLVARLSALLDETPARTRDHAN